MKRSSRVGRVGRVTMEGYGHLPLPASSYSLASPQFGPEQRIYRMYRSCWTKHDTGRRNQFHVTINWLSRIVMMLTRTVFWIYLWIFGKKEFWYFTSLLSYLACRSRIILQVTFAILLDGQLVVAQRPAQPRLDQATNWYCSILKDLTDQRISQRCQGSQTCRYTRNKLNQNTQLFPQWST